MKIDYTLRLKNFIFIALGVAIYAFGFVNFNMTNHSFSCPLWYQSNLYWLSI